MIDKILGTGWKTLSGTILWAVGHSGALSLLLTLIGVHVPDGVDLTAIVQAIGASLAAVGLAHKANRIDWGALIAALKAAADAYASKAGSS